MQHHLHLFRAQRNFYISGFAIFLSLVIRRLIILISQQASLIASDTEEDTKKTDGEAKVDEDKAALLDEIKMLQAELKREIKDKEALKSQALSLNREYDRLTEELSELRNRTINSLFSAAINYNIWPSQWIKNVA